MSEAMYKLEYWVDERNYSQEKFEGKLSQDLEKLDTEIAVKKETDYYLGIIKANRKNIDACHDHLNFDREEVFRAKDELGDELRLKAYPILAEIETRLRRFVTRAMTEVLGFNWWDRTTPKKIRKNVNIIETRSGSKQAEDHHQIEFTMFDDLITFVTGKYQKWDDTKNLTPVDLAELLDDCETFEELKQKVIQKRKQTSLWEDVFSNYFEDKEAWKNLESKINDIVIPIRNKVMHHRLIRIHEVRQLKKHRDELFQIIGTAKPKLPPADIYKALGSLRTLVENFRSQFALDPKVIEGLKKSARIDPEIIKAITQPPSIDPEIMRRITSGINFRLQGFDNEPTREDGNEEDTNADEKNDQNEEDKSEENGENDASEDDSNGEDDKEDET